MMECAYTTSELGASHFDRISAHHHISERDRILMPRYVRMVDVACPARVWVAFDRHK